MCNLERSFIMEENNYRHEDFDDCFLCKHPALRHVLTGLLVFLGSFLAFYAVADWHFKRILDPSFYMRRMDKAVMQRERNFDKMERRALKQQEWIDKRTMKMQQKMAEQSSQFIHVEKADDAYKIVIDLRPFDNDEKNVEVKTDGNTVIINAAGEKTTRHKQEIVKYSQAFAFGEDVNTSEITKVREGDKYIITIPLDD